MDLPGEAREYIPDLLDIEEDDTRGAAVDWVTDYDAIGLGPDSEETRSSGPTLWYPEATTFLKMPTRGPYERSYPVGAVVHYTAGRSEKGDADAETTIRYGASQKHCYFCISSTGRIYQTAPLSHWGSHAGESSYPGLGTWLSKRLVGIEICGAGIVRKTDRGYEPSWNSYSSQKTYYTEDQVRRVEKTANITQAGYYLHFTRAQEESLITLLRWLQANHPTVFQFKYVLGHDEISPTRKQDPGGSLSLLMPDLRTQLLSAPVTSPAPAPATAAVPAEIAPSQPVAAAIPALVASSAVPPAPAPPQADPAETPGGFRVADLFVTRSRPTTRREAAPAVPGGTRSAAAAPSGAEMLQGQGADQGAVGAFVTPQSLASFPIASGVVVLLSNLAQNFLPKFNAMGVTLGAACVIGLLIFLITLSDEQARPRSPLKWAIAILVALINTAFLAASATGLGDLLPGGGDGADAGS